MDAMDTGFLGIRGTREDTIAQALDLTPEEQQAFEAMSPEEQTEFKKQRDAFRAEVRREFKAISGGKDLQGELVKAFGNKMEIHTGAKVTPRPVALAAGDLVAAERRYASAYMASSCGSGSSSRCRSASLLIWPSP